MLHLIPSEAPRLRLATAVLMEADEEWQTEKRYLAPSTTPRPCNPVALLQTKVALSECKL